MLHTSSVGKNRTAKVNAKSHAWGDLQVAPERKLAPGGLKRDFLGRVPDPEACRVCGGSGMNLCSRCRGSGYLRNL